MTLQSFLELAKSPGLGLVCLAVGIWWLNREREKVDARMMAERDAFRGERDKRIALLEDEVKDCKADRRELHVAVNSLQEEVRGLMRAKISP